MKNFLELVGFGIVFAVIILAGAGAFQLVLNGLQFIVHAMSK